MGGGGHGANLICSLFVLKPLLRFRSAIAYLRQDEEGVGLVRPAVFKGGTKKLEARMKTVELGRSGIGVRNYCLGTMTWGTQTPEAEAHAQIDRAMDAGLDLMDTAEMYPVNPVRAETVGLTETIIGNWIAKSGQRDKWVIATKHTGRSDTVRKGKGIGPDTVRDTLEGSLRRLRTDYIDLYQFHWPNRAHYHFRRNWHFDPSEQPPAAETLDAFAATMEVLRELVKEGKIRAFGLSNETAWGTIRWLEAAAATGGPRVATIQNEYSLMCRHYDTDLAEVGYQEDVTLLAFSPLAVGLLTGKYADGAKPSGSRITFNDTLGGRARPNAFAAADAYVRMARAHGLDPVHMALAWCAARPFPTIPIFGATTGAQLDHILSGLDLSLTEEVEVALSKAHRDHPMPY
jgi:aryl-alcohol dehydrogenase-like predicted oxidoreductase